MARKIDPQISLQFARKRKRGGLDVDAYQDLVDRLREDAKRIAAHFKLPFFHLDADRPNSRSRYGLCYSDGRILVRFVNVRTGRVLKYSALIDTVVHELAHLRHMNHGPRWEALYQRMLAWAREQGIYEPRNVLTNEPLYIPEEREPQQMSLFERATRANTRPATKTPDTSPQGASLGDDAEHER